jgi:DNA end-binding protein Ku
MMGLTLRYPYEVRKEKEYFDEIEDSKVTKDMLDLAKHIVEQKRTKFTPEHFHDQYEEALKDLLERKQKGLKIEAPKQRAPTNVVNLMEALRASVKGERGEAHPRRAAARTSSAPHKKKRATTWHKKAS